MLRDRHLNSRLLDEVEVAIAEVVQVLLIVEAVRRVAPPVIQHVAPRTHHEGVAVRLTLLVVLAALGGSNDERLALYRAGFEEGVPVSAAGGDGEGGGEGEDCSVLGEEGNRVLGEAHVVASGEADVADGGVVDNNFLGARAD